MLTGCDCCGARVRRSDAACPVCGAALASDFEVAGTAQGIPVRRYGKMPPPLAASIDGDPPHTGRVFALLLLTAAVALVMGAWLTYA